MPQTVRLHGNNGGYLSRNNIIYFGVRNELGYHFDDIFLYVLEHIYFPNNSDNDTYLRLARSTEIRTLFNSMIANLNQGRYNRNRPKYLELSSEEVARGYSAEAKRQPENNNPSCNFFA